MASRVILLLTYVLARALFVQGAAEDGATYLDNLLREGSVGEAECDAALQVTAKADRRSVVDPVPRLHGHWVSQGCEVRSGPNYILRSVNFSGNLTFRFITFHYSDASCNSSTYSLVAEGQLILHDPSRKLSGASHAQVILHKLSVVPQSHSMAEQLSRDINKICHAFIRFKWKRGREYTLHTGTGKKSCIEPFKSVLRELKLVKTETRVVGGHQTRELLTATATHSSIESVLNFKPLFYTPLVHSNKRHGCSRCHIIGRGTPLSPPHLIALPHLPPLLAGEWLSQRCEALSMEAYVLRRLTFGADDSSWRLEATYYSDKACSVPILTITTAGIYSIGRLEDQSTVVDGASDIDLSLMSAEVAIQDNLSKVSLSHDGCGNKFLSRMKIGSLGCFKMGDKIPKMIYSIVRLEMDLQGSLMLFLGEMNDGDGGKRATSYLPPLVQCSVLAP